jgi:hypothetical protein
MDLFNTIPLMPKAVSVSENHCPSEEALERVGSLEKRNIVLGDVAAEDTAAVGVAVAGIFVAIDPDA